MVYNAKLLPQTHIKSPLSACCSRFSISLAGKVDQTVWLSNDACTSEQNQQHHHNRNWPAQTTNVWPQVRAHGKPKTNSNRDRRNASDQRQLLERLRDGFEPPATKAIGE